jgi:hypothetical protein
MPAASDGLRWFKSSHSGGNDTCVEVALTPGAVLVRDTKAAASGPTLRFDPTSWRAFLATLGRLSS